MSFSGMRPGISLHAWRTVDARVDFSESPCRSLLTVSPPREKPRSTSQEDAICESVRKSYNCQYWVIQIAYREPTRSRWPSEQEGLTRLSHTTTSMVRVPWWIWLVCSNIPRVHLSLYRYQSHPIHQTNRRASGPESFFRMNIIIKVQSTLE
jgi:hypothetical protein